MTYTRTLPGRNCGIAVRVWAGLLALVLAAGAAAQDPKKPNAEDPESRVLQGLNVQKGPVMGTLGTVAGIPVPAGYTFIPGGDGATYLQRLGNLRNNDVLGVVRSQAGADWFIVFMYEECGYVKDDEKNAIDADAILAARREANEAANQERQRQGLSAMTIEGWEVKPHYNPETHNLEWCLRLASPHGISLNYRVKILGRGGVMEAVLVCGPEEFATALPEAQKLLGAHTFVAGHRYDEWRPGDKVAAYGLTALIAGGAAAVALKSGLLQKLIKPIIIGVAAVGAVVAKFFKRLFGRGEQTGQA